MFFIIFVLQFIASISVINCAFWVQIYGMRPCLIGVGVQRCRVVGFREQRKSDGSSDWLEVGRKITSMDVGTVSIRRDPENPQCGVLGLHIRLWMISWMITGLAKLLQWRDSTIVRSLLPRNIQIQIQMCPAVRRFHSGPLLKWFCVPDLTQVILWV